MMIFLRKLKTVASVVLLLWVVGPVANAVPAYRKAIQVTQSDGSTLSVKLYGDESFNYATTLDGYTVIDHMGIYYYAKLVGNRLVSTGIKAHETGQRTEEELRFLKTASRSQNYNIAMASAAAASDLTPYEFGATPHDLAPEYRDMMNASMKSDEEFHSLVILVDFIDYGFITPDPKEAFYRLLNEEGYSDNGATGSARDYYVQNSNGQFNPTFDVVGPFTLPQSVYYYGDHAREFIMSSCQLAESNGVDFSKYIDGTNLRDIFIFYAGYNSAEAGGSWIWPARVFYPNYSTDFGTYGGGKLLAAAFTSELKGSRGTTMAGIGTFCHEFGHIVGWPDFYDTDYDTNGLSTNLDVFSLMASGAYLNEGRTPPALSAIERNMAGWCDIEEITEEGFYTLEPVYDNHAFKINTFTNGEYFVFEYRNGANSIWDRALEIGDSYGLIGSGSGMMVYHVDQSDNIVPGAGRSAADLWRLGVNKVNAYAAHECLQLVMAAYPSKDGYGRLHDFGKIFFPGTANVSEYLASASPFFVGWDGYTTGYELFDIRENGTNNVTFEVKKLNNGVLKDVEITASQTDITVSFVSPFKEMYRIEVADAAGVVASVKTYDRTVNFPGLKPNTTYTVCIYYEDSQDPMTTQEVTTLPLEAGKLPTIDMQSTYKTTESIVLRLINYQDKISSIEWSINGKVCDNTVVQLAAGLSYKIVAKVVNSAGEEEYFIRYINVIN